MDDSQRFETEPVGLGEILFDNAFYVPRRYRVEVEDIGDRNPDGDSSSIKSESPARSVFGAGRALILAQRA